MHPSLLTEKLWLKQLEEAFLLGMCLVDQEGTPTTMYNDDPAFRDAILAYQREKISQIEAAEERQLGIPRRKKQKEGYNLAKRQKLVPPSE